MRWRTPTLTEHICVIRSFIRTGFQASKTGLIPTDRSKPVPLLQFFIPPPNTNRRIVERAYSFTVHPSPSASDVSNLRLSFSGGASMSFGYISRS